MLALRLATPSRHPALRGGTRSPACKATHSTVRSKKRPPPGDVGNLAHEVMLRTCHNLNRARPFLPTFCRILCGLCPPADFVGRNLRVLALWLVRCGLWAIIQFPAIPVSDATPRPFTLGSSPENIHIPHAKPNEVDGLPRIGVMPSWMP